MCVFFSGLCGGRLKKTSFLLFSKPQDYAVRKEEEEEEEPTGLSVIFPEETSMFHLPKKISCSHLLEEQLTYKFHCHFLTWKHGIYVWQSTNMFCLKLQEHVFRGVRSNSRESRREECKNSWWVHFFFAYRFPQDGRKKFMAKPIMSRYIWNIFFFWDTKGEKWCENLSWLLTQPTTYS